MPRETSPYREQLATFTALWLLGATRSANLRPKKAKEAKALTAITGLWLTHRC